MYESFDVFDEIPNRKSLLVSIEKPAQTEIKMFKPETRVPDFSHQNRSKIVPKL